MSTRYFALRLMLAVILSSCASARLQGGHESYREDAAVLSAVIDNLDADHDGYLVVSSEARLQGIDGDWLAGHFSSKRNVAVAPHLDEFLTDFRLRNSSDHILCCLSSETRVRLASSKEIGEVFSAGESEGWKRRFPEKFPGAVGLVVFSLPGYSADRSWAITCVFFTRGVLWGEQSIIVLHRVKKSWTIEWSGVAVFI
jgi:hypothetical protein